MSKTFPYTYIQKKIVKSQDAKISIQSKTIQYGLGCFSGIRGFWNEKQKNLYIFRLQDHFERFQDSASILGMKLKYTYPQFEKTLLDLIRKNKAKEDIYIRPTLYSASLGITPHFDNPDDDLAIYMISLKEYFSATKGLDVCISSWRRMDDDMISIKAKSTGGYAASALAKTEATNNGYDEAIFLNRDGMVCEATGANIFGIKDGTVWTPPLSANILNGITRRTIIDLLKHEMKLEVREENFDRSTLYAFDELFFSGTAAKIAPIASVDRRTIGKGKLGPHTKKLQDLYDQAANNNLLEYEKWCTPVY